MCQIIQDNLLCSAALKGQCVGIEAIQMLVNITSSLNAISAHDNSASEFYPLGRVAE